MDSLDVVSTWPGKTLTNPQKSSIVLLRMMALEPSETQRIFALASRVFWWKTPQDALSDENRFLAQVMVFGTWHDIEEARRFWPQARFREALRQAPAGVFDPRSWSYWHYLLDLLPVPPLPKRKLPGC